MTDEPGLWDWAVGAYGRPGVQAACLDLQDRCGQSVPFLLWAAWRGELGRPSSSAHLAKAAGLARLWEAGVIGPLRTARRALKGIGQETLRDQVKAAELQAERMLLEALETLEPLEVLGGEGAASSQGMGPQAVLEAAARAWSPGAMDGARLGALAQALQSGGSLADS